MHVFLSCLWFCSIFYRGFATKTEAGSFSPAHAKSRDAWCEPRGGAQLWRPEMDPVDPDREVRATLKTLDEAELGRQSEAREKPKGEAEGSGEAGLRFEVGAFDKLPFCLFVFLLLGVEMGKLAGVLLSHWRKSRVSFWVASRPSLFWDTPPKKKAGPTSFAEKAAGTFQVSGDRKPGEMNPKKPWIVPSLCVTTEAYRSQACWGAPVFGHRPTTACHLSFPVRRPSA